jgi:hypothetical protein
MDFSVDRDDADIIRVHRGLHYPQDICKGCRGMGIKAYGNTSTWRHSFGGNAITHDVCEDCWGSGSTSRPWPSWREREQREAESAARIAESGPAESWAIGVLLDVVDSVSMDAISMGVIAFRETHDPELLLSDARKVYDAFAVLQALVGRTEPTASHSASTTEPAQYPPEQWYREYQTRMREAGRGAGGDDAD